MPGVITTVPIVFTATGLPKVPQLVTDDLVLAHRFQGFNEARAMRDLSGKLVGGSVLTKVNTPTLQGSYLVAGNGSKFLTGLQIPLNYTMLAVFRPAQAEGGVFCSAIGNRNVFNSGGTPIPGAERYSDALGFAESSGVNARYRGYNSIQLTSDSTYSESNFPILDGLPADRTGFKCIAMTVNTLTNTATYYRPFLQSTPVGSTVFSSGSLATRRRTKASDGSPVQVQIGGNDDVLAGASGVSEGVEIVSVYMANAVWTSSQIALFSTLEQAYLASVGIVAT